ncbi:MAG: hypothetical protein IJY62_04620 [Clostridia bacterium]|nr:hypothetical protein [Clostridia bacterium]
MENFGLLSLLRSALFKDTSAEQNGGLETEKNLLSALSSLLPKDGGEAPAPPPKAQDPPPSGAPTRESAPNAFLSLMERHERTSKKLDEQKKR